MENKAIEYFSDMSCRNPVKVAPVGHKSVFVVHLYYSSEHGLGNRMLKVAYGDYKLANARIELELTSRLNFCGAEVLTSASMELMTVYNGEVVDCELLFKRFPQGTMYYNKW